MRHEVVSSGRRNRMFDHGLLSLLYPIFLSAHLSHFLLNQLLLSCYLWNLTYERPFETADELVGGYKVPIVFAAQNNEFTIHTASLGFELFQSLPDHNCKQTL